MHPKKTPTWRVFCTHGWIESVTNSCTIVLKNENPATYPHFSHVSRVAPINFVRGLGPKVKKCDCITPMVSKNP
jgi:hypothetical protein